jgi:DNA-binding response OmpR family regulator
MSLGPSSGRSSFERSAGENLLFLSESFVDTILIIQDSPSINFVLSRRLKDAGFFVEAVETGEEGLKRTALKRYGLILLDLTLPGIQGDEVCKALKQDEATKGTPVIFISAREEDEIKKLMNESGADGYLQAPFQGSQFLDTINALMHRS